MLTTGKCYFIKTVTWYYVGRLIELNPTELKLEDASEIAETGPIKQAFVDGKFTRSERYPDPIVLTRSGLMITEWKHKLPNEPSK